MSNKNSVYELLCELPNDLRVTIVENKENFKTAWSYIA